MPANRIKKSFFKIETEFISSCRAAQGRISPCRVFRGNEEALFLNFSTDYSFRSLSGKRKTRRGYWKWNCEREYTFLERNLTFKRLRLEFNTGILMHIFRSHDLLQISTLVQKVNFLARAY